MVFDRTKYIKSDIAVSFSAMNTNQYHSETAVTRVLKNLKAAVFGSEEETVELVTEVDNPQARSQVQLTERDQ